MWSKEYVDYWIDEWARTLFNGDKVKALEKLAKEFPTAYEDIKKQMTVQVGGKVIGD